VRRSGGWLRAAARVGTGGRTGNAFRARALHPGCARSGRCARCPVRAMAAGGVRAHAVGVAPPVPRSPALGGRTA
jgi:hypothetical protein